MILAVRHLAPAVRGDFWRMHCAEAGTGWCYCTAWWVPGWDGWGERTDAQNRAVREGLFEKGQDDGYLLYRDGVPLGWCQAGPRDRLGKLVTQYRLEPEPGVWAVTCMAIQPEARGKGLARHLLAEVLADLPGRGARAVEAFPKEGAAREPGDLWRGPETLFREAGFLRVRETPAGPIYRLDFSG